MEGTGNTGRNKLELVSAHMKVISLMLKTGKKNYECMRTYLNQILMYVTIGNKYRAE